MDVFSCGATLYYLKTGRAPDADTQKPWEVRFGCDLVSKKDPSQMVLPLHFPPSSPERRFLEGLVHAADPASLPPGEAPRRWTAAEALSALEAWGILEGL